MSQQHLSFGSGPDTHTGDTLDAAMLKVEANFTDLYGHYVGPVLNVTTFGSLTSAIGNLPGYGTVFVPDSWVETITTAIVVSGNPGVRVVVAPGARLTIGVGGSITLLNNGSWEQAGGVINVSKTSGDAILITGKTSRMVLAQLNYTGGAGSTNGVVFVGGQFSRVDIGAIQSFPGTALIFGRTGQPQGTLTNRAFVEFINNSVGGGSVCTFASGVSGTDATPFCEGNEAHVVFSVYTAGSGILFGDSGTLHDAQFNLFVGSIHDTSGGGLIPLHFDDGSYNRFDGTLFSDHSASLVTYGSGALDNYVRCPNLINDKSAGAGLKQNQNNGLLAAQRMLISIDSPSIASGFGTGPSINPNGSTAFNVVVGTTPGNSGVINMPTAVSGWVCFCVNLTAKAANRTDNPVQTGGSATQINIQNQNTGTGAAVNFTAGDTLRFICFAW